MKKDPLEFWNERYANEEFIYGTQPNEFFKQHLDKLKPGKLLLPAEGEGRNAVYAASQGWEVLALDMSIKGKEKALQLAKMKAVNIKYKVIGIQEFHSYKKFDAIGLCYAHFSLETRKQLHQHLLGFLKSGGYVILEGFSKAQLSKTSGGPKNKDMLFSIEEIKGDFSQIEVKLLEEKTIELSEGSYHKGEAEVIRFLGKK